VDLAQIIEVLVAGVGVLVELVKLQQAPLQLVGYQVLQLIMVELLLFVVLVILVVGKIT
jgi:hypothetical protein